MTGDDELSFICLLRLVLKDKQFVKKKKEGIVHKAQANSVLRAEKFGLCLQITGAMKVVL